MRKRLTRWLFPTKTLGTPNPRSSRRWNFEISVTGAVPRHGVINWEEFGGKFWWVVLHSQWSTKLPRKFRPKFRPVFRPILRPEFRPVIKICRHNFALGNVRRKKTSERIQHAPIEGHRFASRFAPYFLGGGKVRIHAGDSVKRAGTATETRCFRTEINGS